MNKKEEFLFRLIVFVFALSGFLIMVFTDWRFLLGLFFYAIALRMTDNERVSK